MGTVPTTESATVPQQADDLRRSPLFVVGMWRSGTSLLYALLNQHSQIALMYEGELPVLWPLFITNAGRRGWLARWEFWNSALSRHKLNAQQFSEKIDGLASAMRAVYGRYAVGKSACIWGCKSPNYYDSLGRIARDFPDAQFIIIWRHPADVCRSILRAAKKDRWFTKRGIPHRALFGLHRMKVEADRLLQAGVAVHEIQYEDLVHQPEQVMRGIAEFLRVPFELKMTTLDGADRSAIYEGEHHSGVKSEKIVSKNPRPEVLPLAMKRKIARYVSLWRRQYSDAWPPEAADAEEERRELPSFPERVADECLFRAYRALDTIVVLIYSFGPIGLLQKYRSAKAGQFLSQTKQTGESA